MVDAKCQRCGKIVRPGARFCIRCGMPMALQSPGQSASRAVPVAAIAPAGGMKAGCAAMAGVLVLIAIGAAVFVFSARRAATSTRTSDVSESRSPSGDAAPANQPQMTQPQATFPGDSPPHAPHRTPPLLPPPGEPEPLFANSVAIRKLPTLTLPSSTIPGRSVRDSVKEGGGMKITALNVKADGIVEDMIWTPAGDAFFALTGDGVLSRIVLETLVEERRIDLGRRCSFLALSVQGLLAAMNDLQEVWVIDPASLEIKHRIAAPGVDRILSGPSLNFAIAASAGEHGAPNRDDGVLYIDLLKGEPVHQFQVPTKFARITPDGKYYFAQGGIEQLISFRIQGTILVRDQSTGRIAQNGQGICISPDSKHVCLPSGGGNYGALYGTYVYAVGDLSRPELTIASGAYPRLVGFDPAGEMIYTQNHSVQLMVFSDTAIKRKEYKLSDSRSYPDDPRQFVAHPKGKKLLVLLQHRLLFVEFQEP